MRGGRRRRKGISLWKKSPVVFLFICLFLQIKHWFFFSFSKGNLFFVCILVSYPRVCVYIERTPQGGWSIGQTRRVTAALLIPFSVQLGFSVLFNPRAGNFCAFRSCGRIDGLPRVARPDPPVPQEEPSSQVSGIWPSDARHPLANRQRQRRQRQQRPGLFPAYSARHFLRL